MAMAVDTRPDPGDIAAAERQPGQFARHPKTGAPYVLDTSTLVDAKYKLAELIELCARHNIDWRSDLDIDPGKKPTVPQLKALLGDLAKRGRKAQYGRPSSLGKQIENTTNLQKWSERAVALGVFLDLEAGLEHTTLLDELLELDPGQRNLDDGDARDILDAIAVRAKNRAQAGIAAERGTHTHELTEDHDNEVDWIERARRGEDLGIPVEVAQALVAAWAKMLDEFDIEILATEATCVDDVWRQAGTLDRICRLRQDTTFITANGEYVTLPADWVGILDIKTGKLRLGDDGFVAYWHAYSVQLASYAQSMRYDPDTDERSEWEWPIDQRWAVIAHLDVLSALDGEAKCRLVLVDLEAGREAGALCVVARQWERRRDVFSIPTDNLTVSVPVQFSSGPPPADHCREAHQDQCVPEESIAAPDGTPAPSAQRVAGEVPPTSPATPSAETTADAAAADAASADRRDALKARWRALPPRERQAFRDAAIAADDLDAIEAKIAELERPAYLRDIHRIVVTREMIAAAEAATPEWAGPTFTGDEGPDIADAIRDEMRSIITSLTPEQSAIVNAVAREAKRTVGPIGLAAGQTRRRWEIARALVTLVRYGWDDELVRAALAAATGDDACRQPGIGLGVIVGMLELDQAIAFAELAAAIERGAVTPDASDGQWRWLPAAAA